MILVNEPQAMVFLLSLVLVCGMATQVRFFPWRSSSEECGGWVVAFSSWVCKGVNYRETGFDALFHGCSPLLRLNLDELLVYA